MKNWSAALVLFGCLSGIVRAQSNEAVVVNLPAQKIGADDLVLNTGLLGEEACAEGAAEAKAVRVDIAAKVDELERAGDKDIRARVADFMVKVGDNVPKLLEIGNRLAVLIANTRSKNEEKEKGLS
jgi:aminopeptidase N